MYRLASSLLLLALLWPAAALPAASDSPPDPWPKAAVAYLVVVNGAVLWARAPDQALPPASLTKIMTALLVLEQWSPEAIVTTSPLAAAATGSRLGLQAGDQLNMVSAFEALLVVSANDACTALAEHTAGSVEKFVRLMNRKAQELQLNTTDFRNPCGLDAPGHRSSASDLYRLTMLAMSKPEFARAVQKTGIAVSTLGGRRLKKSSGNQLLGRLDGTIGVKSGFTSGAGKCLVAIVRRGSDEVAVVLLNAPDRWWSASILVEDAFAALDASRH
jgi:D-alanyl-D-alanine carboxypeptidase (penicillin-binding protein 5/6)